MKFFRLMAPLVLLGIGLGVNAQAESLVLSAPAKSNDGSFVLRISDDASVTVPATEQHLEVYRNKDGGEFRRILVAPRFSALSELVRENGTYGYKVRIADKANGMVNSADFSNPVYVEVSTAVPRMVAPRNDKLVSSLDPSVGTIN